MGLEFKLTQEQPEGKPELAVFHLAGWLDAQSEGRLVEAVQKATAAGAEYVLLDLRDLDTVTSAGIRAMQKSYQILTPRGADPKMRRLKLCNAPPQIYQVLSMTGLLIQVPVYESQDIAVDSFGK
jgi:anti-anti-sigma factor